MESHLFLETNVIYEKTNIKDVYFTSPYKIMSPFMDGKHMDIMLMSSSAGLLGGDRFDAELKFGEHSDVTFASQSYDKVFNTRDKRAEKHIKMSVDAGARVKYMPYPVIPFANSNYINENIIHLNSEVTFFYCDIFTCGRTGMGEYFKMKQYQSKTKIYVGEKLDFADHTLINPEMMKYDTMGIWNTYTHNGMAYIYTGDSEKDNKLIDNIRNLSESRQLLVGVTRCQKGLVVRTLGNSGEIIFKFYQLIADKI